MKKAEYYLLFDKDCPFCRWYSALFVRHGFLHRDERISYDAGVNLLGDRLNVARAKDEIALVGNEGEKVFYGIDSLLEVLGRKWKWIKRVGHFFPIYVLLSWLYSLISFNRKIMAPAKRKIDCDCAPSFSWFWRIVFILLGGLITNAIVGTYFQTNLSEFQRFHNDYLDLLFFFGQIGFQGLFFYAFNQKDFMTYAGHISVISLIGALALGVVGMVLPWMENLGFDVLMLQSSALGLVIGIMFLEHKRRVELIGVTPWLTVTWMFYRLLIYPIAFEL